MGTLIEIVAVIGRGTSADGRRHTAQTLVGFLLDITLLLRTLGHFQHTLHAGRVEVRIHGFGHIHIRRVARVHNKTAYPTPEVAEPCVYQTEEHGNLALIDRNAVGIRNGIVHQTDTVAHFKPYTGRDKRVITVITSPVRHVGNARAKAALTETVCVEFGVERRLRVARTHDYLEKILHNSAGDKPVGLPTLAALAGVCAERCCTQRRGGHPEHRFLRRVRSQRITAAQCAAIAAAVAFIGGNDRAQFKVGTVYHRSVNP